MHITDGMVADGIYRKTVIVVVLLPFLLVGLNCVEASPHKTIESPFHVALEDSVLVAGVFHYVDVALPNEHEKICIIAFNGEIEPEPEARSENNFYKWEYENGVWKDASGYDSSYIDPSKCYTENKTYSFYIGISNKAKPGSWTIKILVDNKETSSTSLKVIIGDFCLFFSTIIGVFQPTMKQKTLLVENELRCCYKQRKIETSEENIDKIVDGVLNKQATISKEEKQVYKNIDFYCSNNNPFSKQEPIRSAISLYPRSKLKEIKIDNTKSLFFNGKWGGGKDFCSLKSDVFKRFFMIMVVFIFLSTSMLSMIVLKGKTEDSGDITIINVQSFPLVGGEWTVIFTTVGQANLIITAVNGTTWNNSDQNHDLKFLQCRKGNETLDYQWINESVFISNFSSNVTCYEISQVFTPGVHTLMFRFGNDIAFANNLASENWLQTSTGDFNNGTKNNINVSSGSFHLNERYYLRNFSRINNEGFEGIWLPVGWSEDPSTSNWNKENDRAYEGTYSADIDGAGGSGGGVSGNLLSPSMNCTGSNVSAIYVKFWGYSEGAINGDYYLDYYDGSNWDQIRRLDDFGSGVWAQYSQKITDSQYFVSNFQIRWRVVKLQNTRHVYVDLVNVSVERNESGYYTAGSLISQAHDTTRNISDYNNIVVDNTTSSGTTVTTWVKAADTQANLSTATWYTTVSQLPDKRWVQWRINLTGNEYYTPTVNEVNLTWTYDNEGPISTVTSLSPYWQTTTPFQISATASDNGTGIKEVALYYNYSANNASGWSEWTLYGNNDTTSPYIWSFTSPQGDGYYRFYSRAIDREINIEDPPSSPSFDAFCGVDTVKPSSRLDNITPYWYIEPDGDVIINSSTASDSLSGLKDILLYYRYRIDNGSAWGSWQYFGSDESAPWSWNFNFPNAKGFYQFYSIAIDNAGNSEDPPTSPDNDTECAYNSTSPYSEVDAISPYWHNTSILTITDQATDFNGTGLHNVTLYYYYSNNNSSWSSQFIFGVDTDPWNIISWIFTFPNGEGYYRFYSIAVDNDSNTEYFTGNDTSCGYETVKPSSQVDPITTYWHNATGNPLLIVVTNASDELSGIKNVTLYYQYRIGNTSSWNAWTSFSRDENAPWSWNFNFPSGEGHYRFYSIAYDQAGNREDPPSSPECDTQCGYSTSKPSSQVNSISPYNVTISPLSISATASDDVKNVTIWYYYSSQNSAWWNPCWSYKKLLSITGKNGGYQMKIIVGNTSGGNVTCNGHARSDFGDIRFISYSDNTTQLSYWLKNYTTDTQAAFWLNNSLNDTYIWMYYGNSSASTTSNGTNTFYFFDDFSNGLSKWVMDSWNTDSIYINQSQGNSAPALRHDPDNSIPANRSDQDTRIRTTYKILNGIIEYDVYLAGTPRVIHQFGWRVNDLSWTNGYCWQLQNSAADGGFFEFSAPTNWTQIGTAFPVVSTGTWYHVKINVSDVDYSAKIIPSAPAGDSARSVTDSTKTTADYLVSHVHGVSMDSSNYVLVDNVFVRKYRATPPSWNSFGGEEQGYTKWNNVSNPDENSPWSWNFNFSNGIGYYEFYSIGRKTGSSDEPAPLNADARCHYNPRGNAPTIELISPAPNGTTTVELQSLCQIWANDTEGAALDVYWYENRTGVWILRNTNSSVSANSTVSYVFSQFENYSITYYWKVAVNDSINNVSAIFHFTTMPLNTSVDPLSPYNVTSSPFIITASNYTAVDNVTLYYRWSDHNFTGWDTLTYDDFELGWGNYTDGGDDCSRYTGGTYAHQGSSAANIQDNSGVASSFYHTNTMDLETPGYNYLKVEFWFYTVEIIEDFWVKYNDGTGWVTVADYDANDDFVNDQFYHTTVWINESAYDLTATAQIMFECSGSDNEDDVYIDQIWVNATTFIDWMIWNNASNPDSNIPWNWSFNFPNGRGYYEFYSIGEKAGSSDEPAPLNADARCLYNPNLSSPIINFYDLRNSTVSKLNNITGLLDVNNEYLFTINITDRNGWVDIQYVNIMAWYDYGNETSSYNQTLGSNLNMFLQYRNTTGTAQFRMLWPDNEVQIIGGNCSETIINNTTRIVNISFKPLSQTRWACSNNTWDATKNTTNDPFSWNFNITVIGASGLKSWERDEYGVYKFATILPEKNWVDVRAAPGYNATSNVVNIAYSSNYDYNISIFFEENLTNVSSGDIIPIANNVYICANADPNDDITADMMFNGIRELNAIDVINISGIFHKNNTSQIVHVQFNVYIPFGTIQGEYTAHVATKIKQK